MDPSLSHLPLATLPGIILTTGPLIYIWSSLKQRVQSHGPYPIFVTITTLNSRLYAIFSLILGILIIISSPSIQQHSSLTSLLPTSLQKPSPLLNPAYLRYIYHISKLYEYIDIINLVATGHVIGSHMAFHHLTTPYLTYFRVLNVKDSWQVFAATNCLHHFFMYAYFGGVGVFRRVLFVTQCLQLGAGVAVDAWWLVQNLGDEDPGLAEEKRNRIVAVLLLVRYGMLYARELKEESQQKQKQSGRVERDIKGNEERKRE